jgi:hypothetical protein
MARDPHAYQGLSHHLSSSLLLQTVGDRPATRRERGQSLAATKRLRTGTRIHRRVVVSVVELSGESPSNIWDDDVRIVDPLKGEETGELSSLMEMVFILLFLSANGHHLLLLIISKSYDAFPAGSTPTLNTLVEGVVGAGSAMFIAALRLAAPLLGAFLVLMVALAILARLVPEMDILTVTWPARVGLGLFLVAAFLPFVAGFVTEFADWMGKLLPI